MRLAERAVGTTGALRAVGVVVGPLPGQVADFAGVAGVLVDLRVVSARAVAGACGQDAIQGIVGEGLYLGAGHSLCESLFLGKEARHFSSSGANCCENEFSKNPHGSFLWKLLLLVEIGF